MLFNIWGHPFLVLFLKVCLFCLSTWLILSPSMVSILSPSIVLGSILKFKSHRFNTCIKSSSYFNGCLRKVRGKKQIILKNSIWNKNNMFKLGRVSNPWGNSDRHSSRINFKTKTSNLNFKMTNNWFYIDMIYTHYCNCKNFWVEWYCFNQDQWYDSR